MKKVFSILLMVAVFGLNLAQAQLIGITTSGVAPLSFSPAAGSYCPAQNVTISSGTSGASFYYTLDGSTPTTGSSLYSSPIAISSNLTLKALGVKTGLANSPVATASYTIYNAQLYAPFTGTGGTAITAYSATCGVGGQSFAYYTVNGDATGNLVLDGSGHLKNTYTTGSPTQSAYWTTAPASANYTVSGVYTFSGSTYNTYPAWLYNRLSTSAYTGYSILYDGSGNLDIAKYVAGTPTVLATMAWTPVSGTAYTWAISASGTSGSVSLSASVNGTTVLTATDSSSPITTANFAAFRFMGSASVGVTLSNFKVTMP